MDQRIYDIIEVVVDSIDEKDDRPAHMVEAVLAIEALTATDDDPPNIRYVNHVECVSITTLSGVFPEYGFVQFSDGEDLTFGVRVPKAELIEWGVGTRFQLVMLEAPYA